MAAAAAPGGFGHASPTPRSPTALSSAGDSAASPGAASAQGRGDWPQMGSPFTGEFQFLNG